MISGGNKGALIYWGGFELPDRNAAAHRVRANARILEQLGYRVLFLGLSSERFDGVRQISETVFEEAHPQGNLAWAKRLVSLNSIRKIVDQCDNPKAIILYNLPFITLLRVRQAFPKLRVFYDCTELTPDTDGSRLKKWFKRLDCLALRKWMPSFTDGMIVISRRMERLLGRAKQPVLRVPPLVDTEAPIWHQQRMPHPDTFEYLYAGVLDNNKDRLDTILAAFHSLEMPNVRFRVIGMTRDAFAEYCPQAKPLLQDERILFMGRLSHEETVRHVLSCDCYVFIRPSDQRNNLGFPTKFVEAFTCGAPIIATDISDIREYASDTVQFIPELTSDAIVKAMRDAYKRYSPHGEVKTTFHYANYRLFFQEWLVNLIP